MIGDFDDFPGSDINKARDGKTWLRQSYEEFCRAEKWLSEDTDWHGYGKKANILYTEKSLHECYALYKARRPVYGVRGRPVSRELALEIIRRTDGYLHEFSMQAEYRRKSGILDLFQKHGAEPERGQYHIFEYFENCWFPSPEMVCSGWCHPDGYIGMDGYFGSKNPFLEELLDEWVYLIEEVSTELDVVAVFTTVEEILRPRHVFLDEIVGGFHIRGDTIELLGRAKARLFFRRYDRLYGDHRPLGPLADPRADAPEAPPDKTQFWHFNGDWGIWEPSARASQYMLCWGGEDWRTNYLPAAGGVDKNHPNYYGIPDYSFRTGPLTMDDMERFALKFKEEQDIQII